MKVLKLYQYTAMFTGGGAAITDCIAVLDEASNVKLTQEINRDYTLDFDYPYNSDKASMIKENYTVECEGQRYRIMKITRENSGNEVMRVSCTHIFHAGLKGYHVPTFGGTADTIGASPRSIIEKALNKTQFGVLSEDTISSLGMTEVGADGFLIDFETVDKTTPYDIIQQVITNCGKGELYIDNNYCALVEHIGSDKGVRLDVTHNMQNVTIERDITNMITRLYPYGKDDAPVSSVNNGKAYIESSNQAYVVYEDGAYRQKGYGVKEGYKDYSDYTDPETILAHALWEFDPDNEDRIDVPDINITGNIIDLSKLSDGDIYGINLGDKVRVIDHGTEITERIIRIERYPYEPIETTVSIGRVKKDLFFYLNQMGLMSKRYSQNSTSNGKVSAQAIAGTVTASSTKSVSSSSETGSASFVQELIKIINGGNVKCRIGNDSGTFVFDVYDNREIPVKALGISSNGLSVKANTVDIGNAGLTADEDGNLYINGKKILTEE